MTTKQATLTALALGLWITQSASAQILIFNQDRRASSSVFVVSEGESDTDQQSEVAPDGGPFVVSLFTDAVLPGAAASATGEMNSVITTTSIRTTGLAAGDATQSGDAIAYASAQSNLAIRFSVELGGPYSIQGFLDGGEHSTATVQLSQPFNTVAWFSGSEGYLPVSQFGTLQPGTYDLNITCGGGAAADPGTPLQQGTASYDILFQLNPPTDAPEPVRSGPALTAAPNPFRSSTRLTVPDDVLELRILDARGRLVRSLTPASSAVVFDGRGSAGRPLGSGVYWVRAIGRETVETTRIVRLR